MRFRGLLACAALFSLACSLPEGVSAQDPSRKEIAAADFSPVLTPAPGQTMVHVPAFRLDSRPVTNGQFVEFVKTHAQWRRDRVASLFADEGYLSHWAAPDALGPQVQADQPVTRVSWFAAHAYCAAAGGRLPEWNEWELAAAANEQVADARADAAWRSRILDWYARPATDPLATVGRQNPNLYGIHDLHGLIWEWVEDYGSLMVSSDSRDQGDPDKLEFCGAGSISAQDRENYPVLMRVAFLSALEGRSTARRLGFRCADGGAASDGSISGRDAPELPGDSLYQLPVSLETSSGKRFPLSSLRGSPLLVTMFYGHCNSVCPMVAHQMQLLQHRLTQRARTNTRILMVSFDSIGDTPAALTDFGHQHGITDSRWILARTSPDSVRLLAAVLGIRYRQLPDSSFNHSTSIALADRQGVIQARTSGVQSSDAGLVTVANSMFAEVATSPPGDVSRRRRQ